MTHLGGLAVAGGMCAGLLAGAARLEAQSVPSSFEELKALVKPGDKITVIDAAGIKSDGRIGLLSRDSLTLTTSTGIRQLGERDITEIQQRRGDSLWNGAIIGAVGATTYYVVMGSLLAETEVLVGPAIAGGVIFAGMGAAAGAGIDALIARRAVIYCRAAGTAKVTVSPLLGRGRHGAMVTVRF